MPSGKKIDWSQYDQSIIDNLPNMTITEWVEEYTPHISTKAVGARARKLGVKPKKYSPSEKQKKAISDRLLKETPEMVKFVRDNIDQFSRKKLAEKIGLSPARLADLINRHNIKMSKKGCERAKEASRLAHLGKIPWNKDGTLSEKTKAKISASVSGEKNGQYGRGMTEEEKEKWRESYFSDGIIKMRCWIRSLSGQEAYAKTLQIIRSDEYVIKASEIACDLMRRGKLKYRGKSSKLKTKKGGKFTTKSSYETKFAELLDDDPNVVRFVYEPFKIPYKHRGRKKNYIPDFLVEYIDGTEELIEVKPAKLVSLKRNQAKIKAGENHGLAFRIVTEEDLGFN